MPNPKSVVLALATTVHPGDYFFLFLFFHAHGMD
jgi:hypothetical protein